MEVAAAVWADGRTFGRPDLLKAILMQRTSFLNGYDAGITLLQTGREQNWTRGEYLAAVDRVKTGPSLSSVATRAIKSTLEANPRLDERPRSLRNVVEHMVESFTQRRDALRQIEAGHSCSRNG